MAYGNNITTSIFGRRLGLQTLSTSQSGSGRSVPIDLLVGAEAVRAGVTTETTAQNLTAFGVSLLTTSVSSGVYTLDPPIPGVEKTLNFGSSATSASPIYVKSGTGVTFQSSVGTTSTVLASSQNVPTVVRLIGLSTAVWGIIGSLSTAYINQGITT